MKPIWMDTQGEMNSDTVSEGGFATPLTSTDRSSRPNINKETSSLKKTLDKMDLIDIFRAFHPKAAEYTNFSIIHGKLSRIDHMLSHITSLNKFKEIEIISSTFSDHNVMKLEINHARKNKKHRKTWKLHSNMLLNNEWVNNELKEQIKRYLETNENENVTTPNLGDTARVILKGQFIALQAYLKKQEKCQINNVTLHLKKIKKNNKQSPY